MVLGGGGVGESKSPPPAPRSSTSTPRTRSSRPGPDLPENTRYLNSVIMPDDTVFTTGGCTGLPGQAAPATSSRPRSTTPRPTPSPRPPTPTVGRNYHTEALLLPDGRVAVFGSDPLFGDKDDTRPGRFEQRVEVYTPPYLYHGDRPELATAARAEVDRGGRDACATTDADPYQDRPADPPRLRHPRHRRRPALHRPGASPGAPDGAHRPRPQGPVSRPVRLVHGRRRRHTGSSVARRLGPCVRVRRNAHARHQTKRHRYVTHTTKYGAKFT